MRFYRPDSALAGFRAEMPDPDVPELLYIGESWVPMHMVIGAHEHPAWEMYQQLDGSSRWACGGEELTLGPGDLLLVGPGVWHRMGGPAASKHHFLYACLDCQPVLDRQPKLRGVWPKGGHVRLPAAEAVTDPFRQLIGEVTRRSAFRTEAIRLSVETLVLQIARQLTDQTGETFQAMHPAVWQVKELINTQPGQPWTLADWARLTGVSANHLAGLFAQQVGTPPHRYLLNRRIEAACRLLRDTDAPITQIALECGFSSSQHLAGRFRAELQTSPSAYRKAHRRSAQ